MEKKIIVITGATSGIGKATALELAGQGAHVVLANRNVAKAEAVRREIISQTGNTAIDCFPLDLASLHSVRTFASALTSTFDHVDILINNAGVFSQQPAKTEDGFEIHFGVMYLGHFLLTRLLLDHLRKGGASRVITVSAWGHRFGQLDFDNLRGEKPLSPFQAYCRAKIAQVIFTATCAQHFSEVPISFYSLHPGVIRTNLAGTLPSWGQFLIDRVLPDAQQGASTSVYLATEPDIEHYNGQYFSYRTLLRSPSKVPASVSPLIHDTKLADRLWRVSEQLCQISTPVEGQTSI